MSTSKKYEEVVDTLISRMEKGEIPWQKPWLRVCNAFTGKQYSGINMISLVGTTPYFLTRRQAEALGCEIAPDQTPQMVLFMKWTPTSKLKPTTGKKSKSGYVPFIASFLVYNVSQLSKVSEKLQKRIGQLDVSPEVAKIEDLIKMEKPVKVTHRGDRAFYSPSQDMVQLPHKGFFTSPAHYWSTKFHELGHSTGHESRLKREFGQSFGDEKYGKEELVAELTASFLMSETNLGELVIDNSVAYLQNWLKAIKADKQMIFVAASQAQRAANYILGKIGGNKASKKKSEEVETGSKVAA